jgi:hypothetical protein
VARDVLSHADVTDDAHSAKATHRTTAGGATSVVLLVGVCTLAVVSLASNPQDVAAIDEGAAQAASEQVGGAPSGRTLLTDLRREELVWHAAGRVAPAPDWLERPASNYVAISHEPGGLPPGGDASSENGPWAARRFGTPPAWDWQTALGSAEIDAGEACRPYRFGRSRCGPGSWEWVGPTKITVQKQAATCLWMHPLQGRTLRVRFPKVPAGRLIGKYAFSDVAAETKNGGAVELAVRVGPREALRRSVKNRKGWAPFRLQVTEGDDVTLEVRASKPGRRHFCLQLEHAP